MMQELQQKIFNACFTQMQAKTGVKRHEQRAIAVIYDFLYKVLEHQGLAKNGVVICPDADNNNKTQNLPTKIQNFIQRNRIKKTSSAFTEKFNTQTSRK